jgi:hypothetical protein
MLELAIVDIFTCFVQIYLYFMASDYAFVLFFGSQTEHLINLSRSSFFTEYIVQFANPML